VQRAVKKRRESIRINPEAKPNLSHLFLLLLGLAVARVGRSSLCSSLLLALGRGLDSLGFWLLLLVAGLALARRRTRFDGSLDLVGGRDDGLFTSVLYCLDAIGCFFADSCSSSLDGWDDSSFIFIIVAA
jgi:hypothetical protein